MTRKPLDADQALLDAVGASDGGFWYEVVDAMNEGLLLVAPDRRIVYLNREAEKIIGRKLEDVRGALCVDAINCPQCQCRCRLFEDGRADNIEVQVYEPDGRQRTLLKNARLIRDGDGALLGGVETFSDISQEVDRRDENERQARALFEQNCRLDAVLDAMDDGVLSIDAELRVLMCASRTAQMLGLPRASAAIGQPLWGLLGVDRHYFGDVEGASVAGRTFRVALPNDSGRAFISFRRVRHGSDELIALVRPAKRRHGSATADGKQHIFHGIVSRSPAMERVFELIEGAAQSQSNVLIQGESGVGKELVARAIHAISERADQPFHAVNCATFTGSLLLSELFGHERGAFTGAYRTVRGKLELAGSGTLFLDEVGEIPLHYQAVLLRVIEQRRFERVGGREPLEIRARVLAATNEKLADAVKANRFRADLYYRLNVVPIEVPPLRQRREDVPLLVEHFVCHPAVNVSGREISFSNEALDALSRYDWPGNVRELRNVVEYLCFAAGPEVGLADLPGEVTLAGSGRSESAPAAPADDAAERARIVEALERARYRKAEAAALLGIDRSTLWRKIKRLGIES